MRQSYHVVSGEVQTGIWARRTHVDKGIDAAVLDHLPSVLCSSDVRLAVQRNVDERISVEKLDGPLDDGEEAAKDTEDNVAYHTTNTSFVTSLASRYRAELSQELQNRNNETAEADGAKAIGQGPAGRSARGVLGEVVHTKVP